MQDDDEGLAKPALYRRVAKLHHPSGYARLRAELWISSTTSGRRSWMVHWAASNGDRSENGDYLYGKSACAKLIGASVFLTKRLESPRWWTRVCMRAVNRSSLGPPSPMDDEDGERTITIMGIDEADSRMGQVSWISPWRGLC